VPALPAVESFTDLAQPLLAALGREGVTVPFPIQAATLPNSLTGRDVLGRGRTGSGRTLAFGLRTKTVESVPLGAAGPPGSTAQHDMSPVRRRPATDCLRKAVALRTSARTAAGSCGTASDATMPRSTTWKRSSYGCSTT